MIFSPEELKEVERDCAIYVGRMERVARHSSVSKEEKVPGTVGPGFSLHLLPSEGLGLMGSGVRAGEAAPDVLCSGRVPGGGYLGQGLCPVSSGAAWVVHRPSPG